MFRSQLRQISSHCERAKLGVSTPARHFSCTRTVADEQNQPSGHNKPQSRPSSAAPAHRVRNPNGPLARTNQNQSRPPRVVDARSFAAARAGGGEQPKIIRSPRSRNVRGGTQSANRKPKPSAKAAKGKRNAPRRNARSTENDDGEDAQAAAIDQIQQEQIIKSRPTPIRYEPREINYSNLKETWPSIPTDTNSRSAAIYEKLSILGGRSVLFNDENEKAGALEEVKRLAQLRADRISQRKGDLVEPRNVEFNPIDAESTKSLMETYVQGKYPTFKGKDGHAVLAEVTKNLGNNGTYQTTGKTSQFMAKIESLVSTGRNTKRV
ncbi:hypothetical protein N7457_006772 [Penicillium paradoxum]|uniref:uncharacterized protein n=1 Tax=Penicillium paradoxum TaxID=176176 RepID=UPI002549B1AD|nr:uncharacterized protein N7457_006772 [Penicillium paradoxum]KAJ5779052.1 hypothetical protein N7457_006772 [Penicillium paradoxum]